MTTSTGMLRISDAAVATGVSARTLRYYERTGLIDPVGRAGSTHRRSTGAEAERLALLEAHRTTVRAQLEEAARNLAAIDTKIEMYKERITN
jgi:DNA-binding transcriptional MerR regulator